MAVSEKLDFCRVKKIFDKGFGFLSSLYYEEDIFFHFSKVKDKEEREKLENLKRGEVYAFYTSELIKEKRKVSSIWTNLKEVKGSLIPDFTNKIISELTDGKTNLFEVAHVVKLMNTNNLLSIKDFEKILLAPKTVKNPSIIGSMIAEEKQKDINEILELLKEKKIPHVKSVKEILKIL